MAFAWKLAFGAIFLSTCSLLVASADSVRASQEPAAKKDAGEAKSPDSDATKEVVQAAGKIVEGIELEALVGETWSKATRIEKPLLLYSDNTRDNDRGSLWAWGDKGRPLALIELYQNVNNRTRWAYAICNTSGGKLRAQRLGASWWAENESATEFNDIPNAPAVATEAALRQRQMKQLAQKFTGHEFWNPNNTRYDLRRLEAPLRNYRDEAAGILEGGLYTLANGTNPEIMLFIEARIVGPKDKPKTAWQFGVGRLAHAELHLEYDGKELFTAPRGNGVSGSDRPYWLGFLATTPQLEPKE